MEKKTTMMADWAASIFGGDNAPYLESMYEQYLEDPSLVASYWHQFFAKLPGQSADISHASTREAFTEPKMGALGAVEATPAQMGVQAWIQAYRLRGHIAADCDPLKLTPALPAPELAMETYGLDQIDPNQVFTVDLGGKTQSLALKNIGELLAKSYTGTLATEYMHIVSAEQRQWLEARIEVPRAPCTVEKQRHILERLTAAEGLERYIGAKYTGAKRFSVEGGDALIVMLDALVRRGAEHGVQDMIFGMAHRGRLNVLVNTLGKKPSELFDAFEGKHDHSLESGDVKYHQGFSSDMVVNGKNVHLSLAFNPSHLEIVSPVVVGSVRARQVRRDDTMRDKIIPITIHGDAAFAGQGVVMETLNMSQTRGYKVGGTVHIISNNQVGFTTSCPEDARSTLYCSDVAKMVEAPIFHVNADDPEAVLWVTELAIDFRMVFHKDVVIDLVCYRRHGHNEADEPSMTQPLMYQKIRKHPTVRKLYADALIARGTIQSADADALVVANQQKLDQGAMVASDVMDGANVPFLFDWAPFVGKQWREPGVTALDRATAQRVANAMVHVPDTATMHPRIEKMAQDRKDMAAGKLSMDWGFAEMMAYASLLEQGTSVRLSGEDCGRGTFSHRHAVIHDQKTGEGHISLTRIAEKQGQFTVIDSLLSEEAVLAFEYGYASTDPDTLTLWEAQFGDFANGAQVVIDQFISSGQQKWSRLCGLVMLLPHGYEGMGPEHSSARLERFLQLCAEHNMQVCVPSTPAQVFHMLRRQIMRPVRSPLIVMSPKSLLRHREAVSSFDTLISGQFELVIDDVSPIAAEKIERVVLCSGKVYYDLTAARAEQNRDTVAIVRIEQLYPFPETELTAVLKQYRHAKDIVWCQEEPMNQGAWYASQHHMRACLQKNQILRYAGRLASASPAAGYHSAHQEQQQALVYDAIQ